MDINAIIITDGDEFYIQDRISELDLENEFIIVKVAINKYEDPWVPQWRFGSNTKILLNDRPVGFNKYVIPKSEILLIREVNYTNEKEQ